jgi:hypothetical protein
MGLKAPIFRGKVEGGRIRLDNKDRFRPYLASFEGKRIELIVRERTEQRSEQANAYYHGIVVKMISDATGHDPQETHQRLKDHFKVGTTTKMKTAEFQEYIENCRRFAAEFLNLNIPDPNSVDLG